MCDNVTACHFYCSGGVSDIDNSNLKDKLSPLPFIAKTLYLAPEPKNEGDFEIIPCLMSRKGTTDSVCVLDDDFSFISYVPFTLSMSKFSEYRESHNSIDMAEALCENLILSVAQYLSLNIIRGGINIKPENIDSAHDFIFRNTVPYLADIEIDVETKKIYPLVIVVVNPEYVHQYSILAKYKGVQDYSCICNKIKVASPFLNKFDSLHFNHIEEVASNESNDIK